MGGKKHRYAIFDIDTRKVVGTLKAPSGWVGQEVLCWKKGELYVLGMVKASHQLTPTKRADMDNVKRYEVEQASIIVKREKK